MKIGEDKMKYYTTASLGLILFVITGCVPVPDYGELDNTPYETKACNKTLNAHKEYSGLRIDKIVVHKKKRKIETFIKGKTIDTFAISLGKNGDKGHKLKQGDYRTPEGNYTIVRKKCDNRLYKSLLISYPNGKDRSSGRKRGVNIGGYITIHGQPKWNADGRGDSYTLKNDWTEGCIAVTNTAMDRLWQGVANGVKIKIYP
jgi:murein L,D-transpeptidase YafK